MVGDHIYLNIGGIFSLKPFNLTGIAGGLLFISLSFDEPLLKQYNKTSTCCNQRRRGLFFRILFLCIVLGYVNRLYLVVTIFFLWISEVEDCHSITLLEFYFLSSLYIKHILGAIFILVSVIVAL